MAFNSFHFAVFFFSFFMLYWLVFNRNLNTQNLWILIGSYVFYAWWDWHFLSVLILSSLVSYVLGIQIDKSKSEKKRRYLLILGLIQGFGTLLYFKYYNFFIPSLITLLAHFNIQIHTLTLILPLGISFYTFRLMSYLLDIERGELKPTKNAIVFFSYVSFFPSLISGPIDRAKTLILQIEKKREFNYANAIDGVRQILWGFFKKKVIADNCYLIIDHITFDNYSSLSSSTLMLGAFLFTIYIYADFSGYSDMAIGIARLLGFNLVQNFNFPFFSQNIAEFWRKWHISLTTWMNDYVFTPLTFTFRSLKKWGVLLAILINFLLVGIWHGSNSTYLVYGLLHGCFFIPLIIRGTFNKNKISKDRSLPTFREFINMAITFFLVMLSTVIFRSKSILKAFDYYKSLFSLSLFTLPKIPDISYKTILLTHLFILFMFVIEWLAREEQHALAKFGLKWPKAARWAFYYLLIVMIFLLGGDKQQFIYLQF